MEISFPRIQTCHGTESLISFPAIRRGETLVCMISAETLCDNFYYNGAITQEALVEVFLANRIIIEDIAEHLIKQERFEKDGSIVINATVCKAYLEDIL